MFYSLFKSFLFVSLLLSWISIGNCIIGFVTTQIGPKALWNDTWVDKLKKNLLLNYDRHARPENHDVPTTLKVGLAIVHLETDEPHSTLILQSWLTMKWTDSKLQWIPEDYGDIQALRVADHEVWIPDLYLYNTAIGSPPFPSIGNRNVVLHSHGEVTWVPSITYNVVCDFDLYYWPYDTQYCFIKFGSWVHSGNEIQLQLLSNVSSSKLKTTIPMVEWDVDMISSINSTKYACCVEEYPYVQFNLTMTRKSAPYKYLVVTPAFVITHLILIQFWLPTNAKDKIVLNCLTAAVINIFLLYFNHRTITSGSTPLIVLFYSSSLYIVGILTITAIINYSLCKIRNYHPFAWFTNFLLKDGVSKWLFLEDYSKLILDYKSKENVRELKEHNESVDFERVSIKMFKNSEKLIQLEWTIVAVFLDRFFFIFYSLVFLGLSIAFMFGFSKEGSPRIIYHQKF